MKALTQAQVDATAVTASCFPSRRLPGRSRHLPRRPCAAGSRAGLPGRRGGREVALARLCPLAVVQRPDPPSAHPRCDRGRDRPRHPGLDQHVLHQGAALADLRRLAPGRHLFRPGAEGAGLRLGRADRREPPRPAAWRCCRAAAPRASMRHAALGLAHSINRAGQTIAETFDDTSPVAMACPPVLLAAPRVAVHRRHPTAPAPAGGHRAELLPTHVRVNRPGPPEVRCWCAARTATATST